MSPDRGPVTRCRIKGCPCVGHFTAFDGRCPLHRGPDYADPRTPSLEESWIDQT